MQKYYVKKSMILAHHCMSSLNANIYFRWEVIIIQHPDCYFRHIEVSKNRSSKIPIWVDGGYRWPVDYSSVRDGLLLNHTQHKTAINQNCNKSKPLYYYQCRIHIIFTWYLIRIVISNRFGSFYMLRIVISNRFGSFYMLRIVISNRFGSFYMLLTT